MRQSSGSGSNSASIGLLLLRITLGLNLFLRHGTEKLTHFSQMSAHFPDPVHIGSHFSMIYATLSDAICSMLVVLGLGTRFAAFLVSVNLIVAFYFVHHHVWHPAHSELMLLYIGGFLALVFTGGGGFSLDMRFWGRS